MKKVQNALALKWAKKFKAIKLLGGKCSKCGNDNIFCLEFHHYKGEKEININKINNSRWSDIENEIKKCILLCGNCHSEEHFINSRGSKLKIEKLNELNITECSKCGYSGENYKSLVFHHRVPEEMKFKISNFFCRKASGFSVEDLIEEIKKCDVICKNCHLIMHCGENKFLELKDTIINKVKNHKEKKDINWDLVKKLKEDGKGICDIAKIIGVGKSAIHYIYHKV